MGLPSKDYYRLNEIAEQMDCSIDDLLDYGEQDKLAICVKLRHNARPEHIEEERDGEVFFQSGLRKVLIGYYPLNRDQVFSVRHAGGIQFVSPLQEEKSKGIDVWCLEETLRVDVATGCNPLVISHEEKTRFKKAGNESFVAGGGPADNTELTRVHPETATC